MQYIIKSKKEKVAMQVLVALICMLCLFSISCFQALTLPAYMEISDGTDLASIFSENECLLPVQVAVAGAQGSAEATNITSAGDDYDLTLNAAGLLPLKTVQVSVKENRYMMVGGQSIGILLQTDGVSVVGHSPVILANGESAYPAREVGIESGDFIVRMNGEEVKTNKQVETIVNSAGEANAMLQIDFQRNGETHQVEVQPLYCYDSKSYRIGVYVRDNTAGVGTLTFYDPETLAYGALGHKIADLEDRIRHTEGDIGSILRADIQGIKIGRRGIPGEKLGVFISNSYQGSIAANTDLGIFGVLNGDLTNRFFPDPLPVALPSEVEKGPAQICTVVEGEEIELFDVEIVKVLPNYRSNGKGMVVEITDPDLLEKTGGIVQGMSGSPIIQNGKLVGAISHVFVNEPTKGYACFIEWMLEEEEAA